MKLTSTRNSQRDRRCNENIKRKVVIAGLTALSVGLLFLITVGTSPAQSNDAALVARAKGIHERVLKLDTHNDIDPANFTSDCNYTMRLTTQVNIPKMVEGGMDVSFMIVYVGQGPLTPEGYDNAYGQAVAKFDAIHRLTEKIAPIASAWRCRLRMSSRCTKSTCGLP